MRIEGLARNVGTHAAAVVIADRPLTDYVPLQHVQNKEEVITQWAMADVERAGLLKMDFLGLRNLTILSKVVELIEQTTGQRVDPYSFPLDDAETFALLCRGETKGVFQLESGGIRDLLQRMKPDHFRDIIATNAPVSSRPAGRRHGRRLHPGEAWPQRGPLQASRDERGPGRDPRRDGLPGAGDADPQRPGGHRPGQRLQLHQGHQQEEIRRHRQVSRGVRRRGPPAQGCRRRRRPTSSA